jgi:hypothetical protein
MYIKIQTNKLNASLQNIANLFKVNELNVFNRSINLTEEEIYDIKLCGFQQFLRIVLSENTLKIEMF